MHAAYTVTVAVKVIYDRNDRDLGAMQILIPNIFPLHEYILNS
jgi:hypothetical protein